jgi:hypothetical protein
MWIRGFLLRSRLEPRSKYFRGDFCSGGRNRAPGGNLATQVAAVAITRLISGGRTFARNASGVHGIGKP